MAAFEVIEHTADIGIRAFGSSEAEVFQNAALGMFSLITDLDRVAETEEFRVEIEAEDRETLLVEWLNELLYIFDSREVLLRRFELRTLEDTFLTAYAYGEPIDRRRHPLDAEIKAATYHMLRLEQTPEGWTADVIFDV